MMRNDQIKLLSWNANSIKNKSKLTEFVNFIHLNNYDIIGINETKLDSNYQLILPGYTCYRADRNSAGGGVAILIK